MPSSYARMLTHTHEHAHTLAHTLTLTRSCNSDELPVCLPAYLPACLPACLQVIESLLLILLDLRQAAVPKLSSDIASLHKLLDALGELSASQQQVGAVAGVVCRCLCSLCRMTGSCGLCLMTGSCGLCLMTGSCGLCAQQCPAGAIWSTGGGAWQCPAVAGSAFWLSDE